MSDVNAPERIWAYDDGAHIMAFEYETNLGGAVAFIRADIAEAQVAKLTQERDRYHNAFAAQSRKLQSVLYLPGVKEEIAELKWNDAEARLSQPASGSGVKALEWRGTGGVWAKADALFGATYRIVEYAGMAKPFKLETVGFVGPSGHYELIEEAKSAAQADFDRRIRSAQIDPPSPQQAPSVREYCTCNSKTNPCIVCGKPKFIDPTWLKDKLESDPDEGEIGAGFELFASPQPASAVLEAIERAYGLLWKDPSASEFSQEARKLLLAHIDKAGQKRGIQFAIGRHGPHCPQCDFGIGGHEPGCKALAQPAMREAETRIPVSVAQARNSVLIEDAVQAALDAGLAINGEHGVAAARHAARFVVAALAQPAAQGDGRVTGWRSMDSAPKDGTRFLAFEDGQHFDCWWHDTGYSKAGWQDEADSKPSPTYWRPLPAAPTAPGKEG